MPDSNLYEKGQKITDKELAKLMKTNDVFHGKWDYKIAEANQICRILQHQGFHIFDQIIETDLSDTDR